MILVTGGLGMIGAHTARALADLDEDVIVTAHHNSDVPAFLSGRVEVETVDVTDLGAVLGLADRHRFSAIVHLAGRLPGDDALGFFRSELTGLVNVLEAASTWGVRRFLVASSLGVYAGRPEAVWREDLSLPSVESPHLIVAFKKAVEPLATHALLGSGVEPIIMRIGTVWGPLVDPESPFFAFPSVVSAVLRGDEAPPLMADATTDCCYAPDAGRAIALLATARELRHTTYNVSSGRPATYRELADALRAVVPAARLDLREGGQEGSYLDVGRLADDTGFTAAFDLRAAVADYVAWRGANPR